MKYTFETSVKNAMVLGVLLGQAFAPRLQAAPEVKAGAKDWTLADFRQSYLNQRIVILKGDDLLGSLGLWEPVKQGEDGSFTNDYTRGASVSFQYKDQTPKVLAIRESSGGGKTPKEGQKNVMGETVSDDDIVGSIRRCLCAIRRRAAREVHELCRTDKGPLDKKVLSGPGFLGYGIHACFASR